MEKPQVRFDVGEPCLCNGKEFVIVKFVSEDKVILRDSGSGAIQTGYVRNLQAVTTDQIESVPLESIPEEDWKEAQHRFGILLELERLLESDSDLMIVNATEILAGKHRVSARTIYRWKKTFDRTQRISSLVPGKSSGGRSVSRISDEQTTVIKHVLDTYYFTKLHPTVAQTYGELRLACRRAKIDVPSLNTLRSRILLASSKKNTSRRHGRSVANKQHDAVTGKYPATTAPLEVIQIDHTPVDLFVVGEDRTPLGRPWLTMAIDIHTRMVVGAYLSFDTPGFLGTGIVIANALLPKDHLVKKYVLKSDWPIHGKIQNIHSDNASEFKSYGLQMACAEYNINLLYRGEVNWGGHIERLLGNFLDQLHTVPGTTFSNPHKRGEYNSKKEAVLTLEELERWLYLLIVDIYHNDVHSALHMSPMAKYIESISGLSGNLPSGLGTFNFDPLKVKIDFLPAEKRTVQRTGVQINHIRYYAEVLRPYIFDTNLDDALKNTKRRIAQKLTFKIDPRDLSCIYFLEPKQNKYFPVYYADATKPPISKWEHREALAALKRKGTIDKVTEDKIFEAREEQRSIVDKAVQQKKQAFRKQRQQRSDDYLKDIKEQQVVSTPAPPVPTAIEGPDFGNIEIFTHSDQI